MTNHNQSFVCKNIFHAFAFFMKFFPICPLLQIIISFKASYETEYSQFWSIGQIPAGWKCCPGNLGCSCSLSIVRVEHHQPRSLGTPWHLSAWTAPISWLSLHTASIFPPARMIAPFFPGPKPWDPHSDQAVSKVHRISSLISVSTSPLFINRMCQFCLIHHYENLMIEIMSQRLLWRV